MNLASQSVENMTSRVLYHGGLVSKIDLSDQWYLQPELLYSVKGGDRSKTLLPGVHLEFTFNYLSLPLMLGLNVGNGFSFQAGPEINYLLSIRSEFGSETNTGKGDFPDLEFGVGVGAQYQIKMLAFYARYMHSLTDIPDLHITDINGASLGLAENGSHRVIQVGASFLFPLKKSDVE